MCRQRIVIKTNNKNNNENNDNKKAIRIMLTFK